MKSIDIQIGKKSIIIYREKLNNVKFIYNVIIPIADNLEGLKKIIKKIAVAVKVIALTMNFKKSSILRRDSVEK